MNRIKKKSLLRLPQAVLFASLVSLVAAFPTGPALGAEDGVLRSLEGPDVVITAGKDRTVYEYRQNGQLRIVKIVPRIGRPYYLVPADQTRGFGDLNQAKTLLPQWVIIEF